MEEKSYKNYMWRVYPRLKYYRFQTEDPKVARKLGQRKYSKLVMDGFNTYLKVFELKFSSPKSALKCFKRMMNQKLIDSGEKGLFYAHTGVNKSVGV